jgi:uncharacterized alkaline shock family protein YloU
MGEERTTLGSIHVSPNAIATVVYQAAMQSYGVVGLAPRNLAEGVANTITREPARGVKVHFDGDKLDIDIYVIIEYGTRVATVANSVADSVRFQVEKTVGVNVNSVNVHVQGLRVSNRD